MHHHMPVKSKRQEMQSENVAGRLTKVVTDICRCGAQRRMEFYEDGTLNRSTGWRGEQL